MMVDFSCKNNRDELGDTCKDQIGMKRLLILGPTASETEIIFDVIDISFHYGSDFICIIPFIGSTNGPGISTEIFFGIDINHTAAS